MPELFAGVVGGRGRDALTADAGHGRSRRASFRSAAASSRLEGHASTPVAPPGDGGGGEAPAADAAPRGRRASTTELTELSRTTTDTRSFLEPAASVPEATRSVDEEFREEEKNQIFREDSPLEFANWHFRNFGFGSLFVYLLYGVGCAEFLIIQLATSPYAHVSHPDVPLEQPDVYAGINVTSAALVTWTIFVITMYSVRRLRPTVLKHETCFAVLSQTVLFFFNSALATSMDMVRVNHRYCPNLLITLDYDRDFPRRQCENTNPEATSRCVVESFDITGIACTSSSLHGLILLGDMVIAFIPVFKQTSPRSALLAPVAGVGLFLASGIATGTALPPLLLHLLFKAVVGMSVAWLRYKRLPYIKRCFMVNKHLEQRAERNRGLLGTLIPRSVQVKTGEAASRGEPVKAWILPNITMLCVKFTPSVSQLFLDPATAQSSFDQFNELISALDETVDSFGMYKYQHVYDTYLVSCPRGALPDIDEDHEPYPEDYTIQMVLLAFRIKEVVETFYTHSGERLSVQAGLNCGPAAGAVVGLSRKFYCIYGDMLNTVSRFCANAQRGEVRCSEMFAKRIPRHASSLIHMERLAPVTLKGKGLMEVFLLKPEEESHRHPFFFERSGLRDKSKRRSSVEEKEVGCNRAVGFAGRQGVFLTFQGCRHLWQRADPRIWSAHQQGPDHEEHLVVSAKESVHAQIHKVWSTLLDPVKEALHQGDVSVAADNIEAFLVGLLVLSSTVGITFVHIYFAAGQIPGFLLTLFLMVVVVSLCLAMLARKGELGDDNLDMIFMSLQICCYVTPVLEFIWGGLDVFAFSYFLVFFMPTIIMISGFVIRSVKAQLVASIVMITIHMCLGLSDGPVLGYITGDMAYAGCGILLALGNRRAEEISLRTKVVAQDLVHQGFLNTQEILHDLLPSKVVRTMRDNPDAKSSCERRLVVVLVLDLCNFTTIAQEGTPLQLIGFINSIFSAFDKEVKKQGLFKMDTIGDAYVAAGWLNSLDPAEANERCAAMIRLSQRMLKVLERHRDVSGKDLRCRIGISNGVVYAGVLGRLQPRYHLFGEPMRVAEELESLSAVDSVHVSASVMEALAFQRVLSLSPRPRSQEFLQRATSSSSQGDIPMSLTELQLRFDPLRIPINLTEVEIAEGDEGSFIVRSRSAGDIRVASGPGRIEDVNSTFTTVDEDRSLSPDRFGAAQRSESVPNFSADFRIRRTHASEVPEKTRAEGLALVDHFHASALGRSFHLTLDEAEEGGNGDAEKEHFAHMVSSFSADDSPNTSKRGKDSPLPRAMGSPTPGTTPRQNSALSRFGRRPHNLSDAPRRASAARLLNQGFEDLAGGNGDSPRGGSGGRGVHAGAWGAVNREGALGSSSAESGSPAANQASRFGSWPTNRRESSAVDTSLVLDNTRPPALDTGSPLTLDKRSPLAFDTRRPLALNTSSPLTLDTRRSPALDTFSPLALDTSSPLALDTRRPPALDTGSPLTLDNRSPLAPDTFSPLVRDSRSLLALDTSSPLALDNRSPLQQREGTDVPHS